MVKNYEDMEENLRKRLVEFMESSNLSVNYLSKVLGLQARTLQNQIKTDTSISAVTLLEILFHYPNLSAEWLLRGVGSMLISERTPNGLRTDSELLTKTEEAELRDTIRRQQREIDGLYERIDELKRGIVSQASATVV